MGEQTGAMAPTASATTGTDSLHREIKRLKHELREQIRLNAELQTRNRELEGRMSEIFSISVGVAQ